MWGLFLHARQNWRAKITTLSPETEAQFQDLASDVAFAVHWGVRGLVHGISQTVRYQLNKGTDCLVNFSRKVL